MLWIHFILMWIRIRPKIGKIPILFYLFFSVKDILLKSVCFFSFMSYYSCALKKKVNFSTKKIWYSYNFGWFLCEFITISDPDPDPRFLMWIRIRPNEVDPGGSRILLGFIALENIISFIFWMELKRALIKKIEVTSRICLFYPLYR